MVRIQGQPSEHQQLASRTLRWLACAAREITALELRHALVTSGDSDSLPGEEDLESTNFVIKVCMGLVIVERESGIIRLLHHTALEYLQQNMTCLWSLEYSETPETCFPPPKSSKYAVREIHQDMAKICIKYLSCATIRYTLRQKHRRGLEVGSVKSPFLGYTGKHWAHHWREGFNETTLPVSTIQITTAFLKNEMVARIIFYMAFAGIAADVKEMTMIHVVAYFGLTSMIDICLNNGHDIHATTRDGENALWFALVGKHEGTSKALLQRGVKEVFVRTPIWKRLSSLDLAINQGMRVAADLLLDDNFGARINPETKVSTHYEKALDRPRCRNFVRPLIVAVVNGNLDMTKMLLERGADPLAKHDFAIDDSEDNSEGSTALMIAAQGGYEDIVEFLLHADDSAVNAVDDCYRTPFYWAVCRARWSAANVLLRHGGKLFGAGTDSDPGLPANVSLINGRPSSIRFWGRDSVPMDIGK